MCFIFKPFFYSIKKMSQEMTKSISHENLSEIVKTPAKRGRKLKYLTDEERIEARRQQQKAYRERKKREFEELKEKIKEVNLVKE